MKVLIVSDSHGKTKLLNEIVGRVNPDHIIHCGDFCSSRRDLPAGSLTVVRGNCDWESVPEEQIFETDSLRFFVTHGHRHQVKYSLLPLRYRAQETGAHIACFGHTHLPVCEKDEGILLINPGSIMYPRGFRHRTYAVLEKKDGQPLKVSFYRVDGTPVPELGYEE